MALRLSLLLLAAAVLGHAAPVGAQCTTKADASLLQKSVKQVTNCNYKKLRNGPAVTCKLTPPPACAGTLVDDAMKLAWGANNPPAAAVDRSALHDQISVPEDDRQGRRELRRQEAPLPRSRASRAADAEAEGAPLDRPDPGQVRS